jgi:hypothetical protein
MRIENIPYPRQIVSMNSGSAFSVEPIDAERKSDIHEARELAPEVHRKDRSAFLLPAPVEHKALALTSPQISVIYVPEELGEIVNAPASPNDLHRRLAEQYHSKTPPAGSTISIYA